MGDDLNIKLDLADMTLGDLEQLESRSIRDVLGVCDKLVVDLNGETDTEKIHAALRTLHWTKLHDLAKVISQAVEAEANKLGASGKN